LSTFYSLCELTADFKLEVGTVGKTIFTGHQATDRPGATTCGGTAAKLKTK